MRNINQSRSKIKYSKEVRGHSNICDTLRGVGGGSPKCHMNFFSFLNSDFKAFDSNKKVIFGMKDTKMYENMRHRYTTIILHRRRTLPYDRHYTTCRSFHLCNIRYDTSLCECRVAGVYLLANRMLPTPCLSRTIWMAAVIKNVKTFLRSFFRVSGSSHLLFG